MPTTTTDPPPPPAAPAPLPGFPGPDMARLADLKKEDPQLEAYTPSLAVQEAIDAATTSIEVVQAACEGYADRVALRWCKDDASHADYTEEMTYAQMWQKVQAMPTNLQAQQLLGKKDFVAVCGFASPGWVLADIAALYVGAVVVPLPLNVPFGDLQYMVSQCACV